MMQGDGDTLSGGIIDFI